MGTPEAGEGAQMLSAGLASDPDAREGSQDCRGQGGLTQQDAGTKDQRAPNHGCTPQFDPEVIQAPYPPDGGPEKPGLAPPGLDSPKRKVRVLPELTGILAGPGFSPNPAEKARQVVRVPRQGLITPSRAVTGWLLGRS